MRKLAGVLTVVGAVLLMFAGQAPGTTYTSVGNGTWSALATWDVGSSYPQNADDVAYVNHTVSALTLYPGTAHVSATGKIACGVGGRSAKTLYLDGGILDSNGYGYGGQSGNITVTLNSTAVWGIGSGAYTFDMHGGADLVLMAPGTSNTSLLAGAASDFSGTYIIRSTCTFGSDYFKTGNLSIESGKSASRGAAITYNKTMSGWGTWTSAGYLYDTTYGTGAVVRPGSATSIDNATFTIKLDPANGSKATFASGSTVIIDILSATVDDKLLTTGNKANKVTVATGALLTLNLFTPAPGSSGSISNMVIWQGDCAISGSYTSPYITYNNKDSGWSNLSVAPSGDLKQILFSGDYAGALIPEPGTLLLLGTGAVGLLGFIRRRRMK